jgi:hypothetical protein
MRYDFDAVERELAAWRENHRPYAQVGLRMLRLDRL